MRTETTLDKLTVEECEELLNKGCRLIIDNGHVLCVVQED